MSILKTMVNKRTIPITLNKKHDSRFWNWKNKLTPAKYFLLLRGQSHTMKWVTLEWSCFWASAQGAGFAAYSLFRLTHTLDQSSVLILLIPLHFLHCPPVPMWHLTLLTAFFVRPHWILRGSPFTVSPWRSGLCHLPWKTCLDLCSSVAPQLKQRLLLCFIL